LTPRSASNPDGAAISQITRSGALDLLSREKDASDPVRTSKPLDFRRRAGLRPLPARLSRYRISIGCMEGRRLQDISQTRGAKPKGGGGYGGVRGWTLVETVGILGMETPGGRIEWIPPFSI
jgi:hypothetical protein